MKAKTWIKCAALVLGVIVIPLLYSYFYLGAFWDPYNRLETVPVAVVNEDEGAKINGSDRNLGKEAAQKIVDDGTMKFTVTNDEDATSGVNGSKYYAVIRFPKDFSQKIASSETTDKQMATVTYSANMKHNYICSQIMKNAVLTIEEQTRDSVNKEVTATLVDKLNQVPDKLTTLDDGLTKLNDGAVTLSDGTVKINDNQNKLNDAIGTLDNGMSPLYNGSKTLNSGIVTLSGALDKVADGTNQLAGGTAELPKLVSALPQFKSGVGQLVAQTKTSGDAANPTLYDGISQLSSGLSLLNAQFSTTTNPKQPTLFDGTKALSDGAAELAAKAAPISALPQSTSELKSGAETYVTSVNSTLYAVIHDDSNSSEMLKTYNSQLTQAMQAYGAATDAKTKQAIYDTKVKPLANLVTIYSAAIASPDANTFETSLVEAAAKDPTKASVVSAGAQIKKGTSDLADATKDAGALVDGINKIKGGADSLYSEVKPGGELSTSVAKLSGGASLVESKYTGDYTKGINQLSDGMNTLLAKATDLGKLTDGVNTLNSAAIEIKNGAAKLSDGSTALTNGLATAKSGTAQIASGSNKLAAATGQLNDGAQLIRDGVNTAKTGVEDSMTDTKDQLKATDGLSEFSEKPVEVKAEDINHLPNYGSAFAPYFMSLSLYVGALLIFFGIYLDADERIKVLSRNSDNRAVRVLGFAGIGVAQAIALALICQFALGLAIDNVPAFYGSLILISLVFISIVEFLIVNLHDLGKLLAMAFLVLNLTSCGGTFPMETTPGLFRFLYRWMPMTYSVNLLKEITVNYNSASARTNALVLVAIFAVFTGLTLLFTLTRKAKVKVEEIVRAQN